MAKQVFLSHAAEDEGAARQLCNYLEDRGLSCWMAKRDIDPGQPYFAAILDAIQSTEVMVLLLSSHANASPHVVREVERAVSACKPIVPVRLERIQPSGSLQFGVSLPHWLDAFDGNFGDHLPDVAEAVERLVRGGATLPDPPTTILRQGGPVTPSERTSNAPLPGSSSPSPRKGIITGNRVFVRSGPSVAARALHALNQGDEVEVLREAVYPHSRECQLRDDVEFIPEEGEPYHLRAGRGMVISGENKTHYRIEFRGADHEDTGYVPRSSVVLMDPARWWCVRSDDGEGWVYSRYVRVF